MLWRKLKTAIESSSAPLRDRGFAIVDGADQGLFGDGQYELASAGRVVRLRITRSRGQEFIEFAVRPRPGPRDWHDIGYALSILGRVTSKEYCQVPLEVSRKLPYLVSAIDELEALAAKDADALERRIGKERSLAIKEWVDQHPRSNRAS